MTPDDPPGQEPGEEHSRRRILGSASWATLQQVVTLGATAVSSIILARTLSLEDFGVFSYATTLAAMGTTVVTAGLSALAIKALVADRAVERATMTALVVIRETFAILAYIALLLVSLTSGSELTVAATAVACAVLFARGLDATELWFQSHARSGKTAPVRIGVVLAMLGLRLALAAVGAPLAVFLVLYVAEAVLVSAGLLLRFLLDRRSPGFGRPELATPGALFGQSWILLLAGIAAQINTRGSILVIQALLGSAAVGVYSAAARLSELFYFLPVVFMTATFPRLLGIRRAHGVDSVRYRRELQRSYDQSFWVGVAIAAVMLLVGPFALTTLFGSEFAAAGPVLQVQVLALPFVFMAAVFSKWIVAEGLLVASLIRHAFGAALNISVSIALVPHLGLMGGALATVISYIAASYLACFATRSTRPAGVQMTLAIVWPARLAIAAVRGASRKEE